MSARCPENTVASLPMPPVHGVENEWNEGSQLNFVDRLLIQAPFDSFMMGITGRDENPLVG